MNATAASLVDTLVAELRDELAQHPSSPDRPAVEQLVRERLLAADPLLTEVRCTALADEAVAELLGLGVLDPLIADDEVADVLVNPDGTVWIERLGQVRRQPGLRLSEPERENLVERIVNPLGLRADAAQPMVDARLPDGSRVHAVLRPIAVDGPCLSIRRFGATTRPLTDFCGAEVSQLLAAAVDHRMNVVISGGTGAGKTTFLNALASLLPRHERVVTIEDAAELRLPGEQVLRLEARSPNAEGAGEVTIRDLVRTALRMRPDRIMVGEVRGSEALDMIQAMNTGHDGSLSTCHANSPLDALHRLETMVLLAASGLSAAGVREQVTASVDLVVQVARERQSARRRVVAVDEVAVADGVGDPRLATRRLADAGGCTSARGERMSRRDSGSGGMWWCGD